MRILVITGPMERRENDGYKYYNVRNMGFIGWWSVDGVMQIQNGGHPLTMQCKWGILPVADVTSSRGYPSKVCLKGGLQGAGSSN